MRKEHLEWLQANEACKESIKWIKQNNIQSLENAWYACERGNWLLWMAEKLKVDKHKLVLCAALYAHTVMQYMEDPKSRNAVRIAFLWGRGKATDIELEKASADAWIIALGALAHNVADAAAWAAAWVSSGCAIGTADAVALAISRITDKKPNQLRSTTIIRKICTEDVMKKLKEIK
jgi:hypothetical protein